MEIDPKSMMNNNRALPIVLALALGASVSTALPSQPLQSAQTRSHGNATLHDAVLSGDTTVVRRLIRGGADVNQAANDGTLPLHQAVASGNGEITRTLLEAGADIEARDGEGMTPLLLASKVRNVGMVRLLLKSGARADGRGHNRNGPFTALSLVLTPTRRSNDIEAGKEDREAQAAGVEQERAASVKTVMVLLEADVRASGPGDYYTIALLPAIQNDFEDVALILLDRGARFDFRAERWTRSAFTWAVVEGRTRTTIRMIELSGETDPSGPLAMEGFREAVRAGHLDIARFFLDRGLDVSKVSEELGSLDPLLLKAATDGHADIVRLLLDMGATVSPWNEGPRSPLGDVLESKFVNVDVVQALVESGADVNRRDRMKRSLIFTAIMTRDPEIVEFMLTAGAKLPTAENANAVWSPLTTAAMFGNQRVFRLILDTRPRPDMASPEGATMLAYAAFAGHTELTHYILTLGTDVNMATKHGGNALTWAAGRWHAGVVRVLLNSGANVNDRGRKGQTALMRAASEPIGWTTWERTEARDQIETVKLLLDAGADPHLEDDDGKTAMMLAGGNNHEQVVKMLKKAERKVPKPWF